MDCGGVSFTAMCLIAAKGVTEGGQIEAMDRTEENGAGVIGADGKVAIGERETGCKSTAPIPAISDGWSDHRSSSFRLK